MTHSIYLRLSAEVATRPVAVAETSRITGIRYRAIREALAVCGLRLRLGGRMRMRAAIVGHAEALGEVGRQAVGSRMRLVMVVLRRGLGSDEGLLRGHGREVGHSAPGCRLAEEDATQGGRADGVIRYGIGCTWEEVGASRAARRDASGMGRGRRARDEMCSLWAEPTPRSDPRAVAAAAAGLPALVSRVSRPRRAVLLEDPHISGTPSTARLRPLGRSCFRDYRQGRALFSQHHVARRSHLGTYNKPSLSRPAGRSLIKNKHTIK